MNARRRTLLSKIPSAEPLHCLGALHFHYSHPILHGYLSGVPRVKLVVSLLNVFIDSTKLPSTQMGPGVPTLEFVLGNQNVTWSIYGANSLVKARPRVACLTFADVRLRPKFDIVIGAHQLEDNLVQFDLGWSRLGFSSSLPMRRTNCANFKDFSSNPSVEIERELCRGHMISLGFALRV